MSMPIRRRSRPCRGDRAAERQSDLDAAGQLVAQVANTLTVRGGEVPAEAIANHIRQPLPAECPGPYRIIGKTIGTGE